MEFMIQVCGAMLLISVSVVAVTIATVFAYATVVIIKSAIEDNKKARKKKAKNEEKQI